MLRHCRTVGVAMRYFAEKYGEDADYWESVGILHDIDFEQHPEEHCKACVEIFNAEHSHKMEKVLFAVDELTGLIFACAMARPSKSVMDMELKSVTKKFKDKAASEALPDSLTGSSRGS